MASIGSVASFSRQRRDSAMDEFQVPVNIAVGLDEISQMCHFLIVNTTQKSVMQPMNNR